VLAHLVRLFHIPLSGQKKPGVTAGLEERRNQSLAASKQRPATALATTAGAEENVEELLAGLVTAYYRISQTDFGGTIDWEAQQIRFNLERRLIVRENAGEALRLLNRLLSPGGGWNDVTEHYTVPVGSLLLQIAFANRFEPEHSELARLASEVTQHLPQPTWADGEKEFSRIQETLKGIESRKPGFGAEQFLSLLVERYQHVLAIPEAQMVEAYDEFRAFQELAVRRIILKETLILLNQWLKPDGRIGRDHSATNPAIRVVLATFLRKQMDFNPASVQALSGPELLKVSDLVAALSSGLPDTKITRQFIDGDLPALFGHLRSAAYRIDGEQPPAAGAEEIDIEAWDYSQFHGKIRDGQPAVSIPAQGLLIKPEVWKAMNALGEEGVLRLWVGIGSSRLSLRINSEGFGVGQDSLGTYPSPGQPAVRIGIGRSLSYSDKSFDKYYAVFRKDEWVSRLQLEVRLTDKKEVVLYDRSKHGTYLPVKTVKAIQAAVRRKATGDSDSTEPILPAGAEEGQLVDQQFRITVDSLRSAFDRLATEVDTVLVKVQLAPLQYFPGVVLRPGSNGSDAIQMQRDLFQDSPPGSTYDLLVWEGKTSFETNQRTYYVQAGKKHVEIIVHAPLKRSPLEPLKQVILVGRGEVPLGDMGNLLDAIKSANVFSDPAGKFSVIESSDIVDWVYTHAELRRNFGIVVLMTRSDLYAKREEIRRGVELTGIPAVFIEDTGRIQDLNWLQQELLAMKQKFPSSEFAAGTEERGLVVRWYEGLFLNSDAAGLEQDPAVGSQLNVENGRRQTWQVNVPSAELNQVGRVFRQDGAELPAALRDEVEVIDFSAKLLEAGGTFLKEGAALGDLAFVAPGAPNPEGLDDLLREYQIKGIQLTPKALGQLTGMNRVQRAAVLRALSSLPVSGLVEMVGVRVEQEANDFKVYLYA